MEGLLAAARAAGVRDGRVLAALAAVPRSAFVPVDRVGEAGRDAPVLLPDGQTTSQPSLIARTLEVLRLQPGERVLEVGAGCGWQTALLDRLVAPGGAVWGVERHAGLAASARSNLAAAGVPGPTVVVGDGTKGLPDAAPFDVVVVCAAAPEVPPPLVAQLREGGRLVQPVVVEDGREVLRLHLREDGRLVPRQDVVAVRFVPLVEGLPG